MPARRALTGCLLALAALASGSAGAAAPSLKAAAMATSSDPFQSVALNTRVANACSPQAPDDDWHGILIRAPQSIVLARAPGKVRAEARGPICGLYRIGLSRLSDGVPMLLKAADRATGRQYTGVVIDQDRGHDEPPPPGPAIDPARLARMSVGSHFNLNLFDYLALPHRTASYELLVEYGGLQSNRLEIEVREAP